MTFKEVIQALESLGTEQNRKIYRRHGAGDNLFGVSFANFSKLKKKIRIDHGLAGQLWQTGNTDARTLATMIADPSQMSRRDLDSWVKDIQCYGLADLFARNVVAKSPIARQAGEAWRKSKEEYTGQVGWDLLALEAMMDASLPDSYFEERLEKIEASIHKAKNRTRYAMNGALIAIGIRNSKLRKLALAAAGRIGSIDVDHGETGCKTPDAAAYIRKAVDRKKERASHA